MIIYSIFMWIQSPGATIRHQAEEIAHSVEIAALHSEIIRQQNEEIAALRIEITRLQTALNEAEQLVLDYRQILCSRLPGPLSAPQRQ